ETDALYFSQVRSLSPISVRDVNTLKKIYQQPTRLGWKLP
ncbi:MAG: peptidase, partial [cyanobacterium endosymbiont of Rhopalodia inflata]